MLNENWILISATGLLAVIFSIIYLIFSMQRWGGVSTPPSDDNDAASLQSTALKADPKKPRHDGADKAFLRLLKRLTLAVTCFSLGVILLIAGAELGEGGTPIKSISIDGPTIASLVSLIIAIPTALASALVVISLGKNQDELGQREREYIKVQMEKHKNDEKNEIISRVHLIEVKFTNLWDAYESLLHSNYKLNHTVNVGNENLTEKFYEPFSDMHELDVIREKEGLFRRELEAARHDFPLEEIESSTRPGRTILFKTILPPEQASQRHQEMIEQLAELRTQREAERIWNSVPAFQVSSRGTPEFISDLEKSISKFVKALSRVTDSMQEIVRDTDCLLVIKDKLELIARNNIDFFSKIKSIKLTCEDYDDEKYLESFSDPSARKIFTRLEELLREAEGLQVTVNNKLSRSTDEIRLPEIYPTLSTMLAVRSSHDNENTFAQRSSQISTTLHIPFFDLQIRVTEPFVDGTPSHSMLQFSRANLLFYFLGLALPVQVDVLNSLRARGVFNKEAFESIEWKEKEILRPENEYLARAETMKFEYFFDELHFDISPPPSEIFDREEKIAALEQSLRRLFIDKRDSS